MSNSIEITNTHVNFVLKECEIRADYVGTHIHNVSPGTATLEDNVLIGNNMDGGGIVLGANGVLVKGNKCTGFVDGIHTNYADECVFVGNYLSGNKYHGIYDIQIVTWWLTTR
jgi:nitrous oxidase accessory protein NosD